MRAAVGGDHVGFVHFELAGTIGDELFYVNPTGRVVIGGPDGDAGLTGEKSTPETVTTACQAASWSARS